MSRHIAASLLLLAFSGMAMAQEEDGSDEAATTEPAESPAPAGNEGGVKTLSGMSILGNEETPTSLVIVPWKSSEIGDGIGVSNAMDDRARPVDKEVFMREVHYWKLRSGGED